MSKLSYKTLFIIFFFLLIGVIVLSKFALPNQKVSAAWWNDMWNYRKAISISNTSGSNLTDFQVSLSVGTSALIASGKMQSDCDDIRVTDINGNLLPYWIEENNPGCNAVTDTKIWIKASSLPTSGAIVYIYYGNSSATNNQNGNNVFEFFDDFNGSILNTSKWTTVVKGVGGSSGISGGNAILSPTANTISSVSLLSSNTFTNNITIEIRRKQASNSNYLDFSLGSGSVTDENNGTSNWWHTTLNQGYWWYFQNTSSPINGIYLMNNASKSSIGTTAYSIDTSYYLIQKMTLNPSGAVTQSNNGTQIISGTDATFVNTPKNLLISQGEYTSGAGDPQYIDYIFVHKYASADPTPTLQSEEIGTAPIAYWKFDEGIGTTIYDSTSNRNNGILGAGNSAPTWADESQCISGKCLKFDGNGSELILDNNISMNPNNSTISWWMKKSNNRDESIFSRLRNGSNCQIDIQGSNRIRIESYTNNVWYGDLDTKINTADNKWHYYSIVFSNSDTKLYVDSKLSDVNSANTDTANFVFKFIGTQQLQVNYSTWFTGSLDDIKIYPYTRTAAQIKLDYNASKAHSSSIEGTSTSLGSNKNNGDLSDGLVGYWKMDEGVGTTIADSSGIGNTGTLSGATIPEWSSGKFGNSINLSSNNDYINIGEGGGLFDFGSNNFSISFWMNPDSLSTAFTRILGKASGASWENGYAFSTLNNTFAFWINGQTNVAAASLPSTGVWHHIIGTYDHSKIKLYIDGIEVASTPYTQNIIDTSLDFRIGTIFNGGNTEFDGKLDEVRLYNRALSPSEVSDLYNYAPGPITYYDLNEASGTTVYDKSGNNKNGTLQNSPSWIQGKIGGSLDFKASGQRVLIGTTTPINGQATATLWYKRTNTASTTWRTLLGDATANIHPLISEQTTRNLGIWDGSWRDFEYVPLDDNQFHHYTVIYDVGTSATLYVDGVYKNKIYTTLNLNTNPIGSIGNFAGGNYWAGSIDDVKIYNYARSQKQIIEDMNAGAPATSAKSIIAYYKFDEGQGTIVNNWGNGGIGLSGISGTGSSSPTWTNDGKFNKALSFDGSDYIRFFNPILDSIGTSGDFTVTTWNKQSSFSGVEIILGQGYGGAPGGHTYGRWQMGTSGSRGWISLYGGSSSPSYKQLTGTINLLANTWNQITTIFSRSEGKLKLYVNGKFDSQLTWDGYMENIFANRLALGYNSGTNDQYMNGLIDEVKIYNYALTSDEIKQDYNQGSATSFGSTTQTIGATTTSLDYCIPGDTSYCASPIAEYKMDEGVGTSAFDTSGNNINAGFSGTAPAWVQGKIGKALNFNGTNAFLSNTRKTLYTVGLTFGVWIKTTSTDSTVAYSGNAAQNIIGDSTGGVGVGFGVHGGKVRYQHYSDAWYNVLGTTSVNDGLWHYINVTHDKTTGNIVIYVDGKQDAIGNITYGWAAYDVIARGYSADYFTGQLDNFRIYNYARTPAQIAYDYNKGGPVGWWKFDECQGNIAYDWSGIGNTGVINIGASGSQNSLGTCQVGTSAAWTNGATGKINSSLNFDGADDYITISNPSNNTLNFNATQDFTISLWIKTDSTTDWDRILGKSSTPRTETNWYSVAIHGNKARLELGSSYPSQYITVNTTSNVNDNKWHNVIYTRNKSTTNNIKAYFDGKLETISGADPTGDLSNNAPLNFMKDQDNVANRSLQGQIDDVRIYNYALTSEQIKILYNNGSVSFN